MPSLSWTHPTMNASCHDSRFHVLCCIGAGAGKRVVSRTHSIKRLACRPTIMAVRLPIRALVGTWLVVGVVFSQTAGAQGALPPSDGPALDSGTTPLKPYTLLYSPATHLRLSPS